MALRKCFFFDTPEVVLLDKNQLININGENQGNNQARISLSLIKIKYCKNFSFWGLQNSLAFARSTYAKQNYVDHVFRPPGW